MAAAFTDVVEDFLLDQDILLGPFDSFRYFQELFPAKYRDHHDVKLLFKAFQRQRHQLRDKVTAATRQRYHNTVQNDVTNEQYLEDASEVLENAHDDAKQRLQETKSDIKHLEKEIGRLTKRVEANCFTDVLPDDFNITDIQELQNVLKRR